MKKKEQKNKRKSDLKLIFFVILVAAALFIISTYAWFSTQKNVSITNLSGIVEVAEGLEISLDAYTWYNEIVLGTEEGQLDIIDDAYADHRNISPKELLPVSTLGLAKTADKLTDLKLMRGTVENSIKLKDIIAMDESLVLAEYDEENDIDDHSGNDAYPGYFAFDIFLKNTSKLNTVMDVLQLNYDSSVQVLESTKSSTGLQNTVRVAFAKYGEWSVDTQTGSGVVDADVYDQATILKETAGIGVNAPTNYISDVAIWEPNSADHADYIVTNNNKITWSTADAALYATKDLGDSKKGFDLTTKMPTYGLKDTAIGQTINNIYAWDGSESLIQKQNTLQTTKTKDEDYEISTDDDYTISEGVQNLVSTSDGKTAFSIAPNKICRMRVYVWLEGQDVDCINYASYGGGVKVDIGLVKGSTVGSHGDGESLE